MTGFLSLSGRIIERHCLQVQIQRTPRRVYPRTSAAMLWEFEKNGGEELEKEIAEYLDSADSKRATLEGRAKY